jgi:predicted 3-demethylubiquinone-9 3-methyltransferase (glyoxalase superfamily)
MQQITPFLWFDTQAEEAVKFYTSLFKKSRIGKVLRYNEAGARASGRPPGSVMTIEFSLAGQDFVALNGGPIYKFSEAVSFVVNCDTQTELDRLWKKLSAGGQELQCGWLTDKFGLTWQIVPSILGDLLGGKDPDRSQRVMTVLMSMVKLDIEKLKRAAKATPPKKKKRRGSIEAGKGI